MEIQRRYDNISEIQFKLDVQYKKENLTNKYADKSKTVIKRITEESLSQHVKKFDNDEV